MIRICEKKYHGIIRFFGMAPKNWDGSQKKLNSGTV
jgi:hypothetical protein